MQYKLIMENWRKYKKSLNEQAASVTRAAAAAGAGTAGYEIASEPGEFSSEFIEFLIEMAVIFLAEPKKVYNNQVLWNMIKKHTGLTFMKYKSFTLEGGKALSSAQRAQIVRMAALPFAQSLAYLRATPAAQGALARKLIILLAPILGTTLKVAAVVWLLSEIFKITYDVTSQFMKAFGYQDTEDEIGNYNWMNLSVDFAHELISKYAKAVDHPIQVTPPGQLQKDIADKSKTEQNFDTWPLGDQIGWCLRNTTPKNYKGTLTCKAVLDKADPKTIARIRKALGIDGGAGMTDDSNCNVRPRP